MRVLLDTHAGFWFILNDSQLSVPARTLIEDPANDVEVSPASYWEIAIKIGKGKYTLPQPYETFMERLIITPATMMLTHMELHSECRDCQNS